MTQLLEKMIQNVKNEANKEILIKRQKVLTYYINNEFEHKYVIEFVLRIIEIPM